MWMQSLSRGGNLNGKFAWKHETFPVSSGGLLAFKAKQWLMNFLWVMQAKVLTSWTSKSDKKIIRHFLVGIYQQSRDGWCFSNELRGLDIWKFQVKSSQDDHLKCWESQVEFKSSKLKKIVCMRETLRDWKMWNSRAQRKLTLNCLKIETTSNSFPTTTQTFLNVLYSK